MEKPKFKIGDTITHKEYVPGFEEVTIFKIDSKAYHCRIPRGFVTISISTVNNNYKKV